MPVDIMVPVLLQKLMSANVVDNESQFIDAGSICCCFAQNFIVLIDGIGCFVGIDWDWTGRNCGWCCCCCCCDGWPSIAKLLMSPIYFAIGMEHRVGGGWKPSGRMHVEVCDCNISVSVRRSISSVRTCVLRSMFWCSNISDSLTKFRVRSRFFMRHFVAAILFRSRRLRLRSSSSGVN